MDGCVFSASFRPIFTKKLFKLVCYFLFCQEYFWVGNTFFWEVVVHHFCFPIDFFYYFLLFLYIIFIFHDFYLDSNIVSDLSFVVSMNFYIPDTVFRFLEFCFSKTIILLVWIHMIIYIKVFIFFIQGDRISFIFNVISTL